MDIKVKYYIYEKRTEKNMSARQLAMLSGVSHTEINNIESEKKHPNILTLCRIAEALKAEPCSLFSYEIIKSGN